MKGKDSILQDSYDTVFSRLRNPLLSSFIITFLIHNWELTFIFLFAQNTKKVELFKQVIESSSICDFFWIPLAGSFFYLLYSLLITPLIFNIKKSISTRMKYRFENAFNNSSMGKGMMIRLDTYLNDLREIDIKKSELAKALRREDVYKKRYSDLLSEITEEREHLSKINLLKDKSRLDGCFLFLIKFDKQKSASHYFLEFQNGLIDIYYQPNSWNRFGELKWFLGNDNLSSISGTIKVFSQNTFHELWSFECEGSEGNVYKGIINKSRFGMKQYFNKEKMIKDISVYKSNPDVFIRNHSTTLNLL